MGMFDTVDIPCPGCGAVVDCQSKSGDCNLDRYTLDTAPVRVMAGLIADNGWRECDGCKRWLWIEPTGYKVGLARTDIEVARGEEPALLTVQDKDAK